MITKACPERLTFSKFDQRFLDRSWHWLKDAELKRLTMTPDFNRDEQARWFARLPEMEDYLIWGLCCDDTPVGAVGLKHITKGQAEYWGYIGERRYWGTGLGGEMMRFAFSQARRLGLKELYLKVHRDNVRAIRLYSKTGFRTVRELDGVLHMERHVGDVD